MLTAQSAVISTVIICPLATVNADPGAESTVQPPGPPIVTDHSPSTFTSPAVATACSFGAVKPVGIVNVGLIAPNVIPPEAIVKTALNICDVPCTTVTPAPWAPPSTLIVAVPSPAAA